MGHNNALSAMGRTAWALAIVLSLHVATATAQPVEPFQHEFIIKDFRTESGVLLPEARITYGTYGKLNAAGDNAILLPSHYMAKFTGYG